MARLLHLFAVDKWHLKTQSLNNEFWPVLEKSGGSAIDIDPERGPDEK